MNLKWRFTVVQESLAVHTVPPFVHLSASHTASLTKTRIANYMVAENLVFLKCYYWMLYMTYNNDKHAEKSLLVVDDSKNFSFPFNYPNSRPMMRNSTGLD